jgi:hypothetical protein
MRSLMLLLACLISWPAAALDVTVGATDCATWLQERAKEQSFHGGGELPTGTYLPSTWIIGFLEGYDWACPRAKPRTDGLDMGAVFERVDRICRAKTGGTPLLLVALDLVKELDPQHSGVCVQ